MTEEKKEAPKKRGRPKKESSDLVKMVHEDGRKADVHPSMVDAYKSGGYKEV